MFLRPAAPLQLAFPWPRDPLTARLIAVMLLSLGAALVFGRRDRREAAVALVFVTMYGAGVVAACAPSIVAGAAFPPLYAAALGGVGLLAAVLLWKLRQSPATLAAR